MRQLAGAMQSCRSAAAECVCFGALLAVLRTQTGAVPLGNFRPAVQEAVLGQQRKRLGSQTVRRVITAA